MKTRSRLLITLLSAGLMVAAPTQSAAQAAKPTRSAAPAAKATGPPAAAAKADDQARVAAERREADRLFEFGKTEEAKATYLRIAPSFADDFEFNKRLAYCLFISPKKEMDKAARYYARAYELNPKDPQVESNLGKAYSWAKQYNAAIAVFRRILARDPANNDAWVELARAQNQAGQTEAARATYQSYIERRPADREVRLEFAAFLSWNKQPELALQHYRYVLKADPNNVKARLGEAEVLAWQGKLKESLQAYNEILSKVPGRYEALRGKAFVLLWLQRYEEASNLFAQVTQKKRADPEIQDALRQIARWKAEEPARRSQAELDALRRPAEAAIAQNDLPRAIELLKQAIARLPQERSFRFRLGEVYAWNRQWPEAIETFQKLSAEQPENLNALRELGNAQVGGNRLADAAATFRTYLERSSDPGVRLSLARVLSWSGKLDEAISVFQQILQSEPDNFDASLGLAQTRAWRGEHAQASELFDALLRKRPGNREALLGKAQVLHWGGSPEKAVAVLETMRETWPQDREIAGVLQSIRDAEAQRVAQEAAARRPVDIEERIRNYQETLTRNPNSIQALQRLGELYETKKDFAQAITHYEKALALQPSDTALRVTLARVASWNRDFPRAISLYQGLLAQDPENREYRMELAKILSWSGHNAESIAQYREILKRVPENGEVRLGLARVLSWNKQLDESLAEYNRLLKADPQNREALIERARVYSWKGELSAALNLYDELLIRAPEDKDARFGKAQTLYWSGRSREAKEILEDMQAKYPKDRDVILTAAGVHTALGRRDLALRQLDALDKMQPGNTDVELMRRSIRQDLRPALILGFTPSVDSFDLKIYHSTATLHFSPTPRIRSYVFAGVIPSRDPGSRLAETGRELLFGSSGRVTDWLLVRGEIGVNSATSGHEGPIGGAGATFFVNNKMQFDFDVSRRFINYIPRPILLDINRVQLRAGWDWRPERRTTFHVDYYHQRYSDTNRNNGGNFTVTRNLVRNERWEIEAGYLYSAFGFTKNINSGFFAPSQFQRHAAIGNLRAKVTPRNTLFFWGSLGREQVFRDPFRLDGTARAAWEYSLSDYFKFSVGYGYFAISTIVRAGGYTTRTGYVTLEFRF